MENLGLYEDIAKRTDGDIYVGVVGPVRTGKSTFIKLIMNIKKKELKMSFHKALLVKQ